MDLPWIRRRSQSTANLRRIAQVEFDFKQAALQVVSKENEKKEEATDGYPVTRSNVSRVPW